jgi:hypothetical protein
VVSFVLALMFVTPRSQLEEEPGLGGPEAPAGGVN